MITCQVFHVYMYCPNLFCMLLITSSQTSSVLVKKIKMADLLHSSLFTLLILPCGHNITSSQTILIMAEKIKMTDYQCVYHFTLLISPCGHDNFKSVSIIYPNQIFPACC